ncbi:MAG: hypothetical protein QXY45_00940 [Candidatus Aenigmatarchaeota archaeon]
MKAQMSLEYIVKMMILLVVVVVVIGLILKFSSDLKLTIKKLFGEEKKNLDFPQIIEKNDFSAGEVSVYIESCYSQMTSLKESEQKDIVCYLLKSRSGFGFSPSDIRLSLDLTGRVEFNTQNPGQFTGNALTIKFLDAENKIEVSD